MALALENTFPHTLTIDGQPVRIRVPRFDADDLEAFRDRYHIYVVEGLTQDPEEALDTYTRRARSWAREQMAWLRTISAQVSIEPGELTLAGQEVTDLLQAFPGREDVVAGMLVAVLTENTLSEDQKKDLRSQLDSRSGFATRNAASPATPGERPAPPAGSAESVDSASPGSATTDPDGESSGVMDPSSSVSVLSGV